MVVGQIRRHLVGLNFNLGEKRGDQNGRSDSISWQVGLNTKYLGISRYATCAEPYYEVHMYFQVYIVHVLVQVQVPRTPQTHLQGSKARSTTGLRGCDFPSCISQNSRGRPIYLCLCLGAAVMSRPECSDCCSKQPYKTCRLASNSSYECLLLPAKCQPNYTNRTLPWTLVSILSSHHSITVHFHPDQPWIRSLPPGHVLSTGQRVRAPDGFE